MDDAATQVEAPDGTEVAIGGTCQPGFEGVRDAFTRRLVFATLLLYLRPRPYLRCLRRRPSARTRGTKTSRTET